jgi:Rieske Fe-S protein
MNRRSFFGWTKAGVMALWTAGAAGVAAAWRFLWPSVTYEPPLEFKAGPPEDIPVNVPVFLAEESVFVFRDRNHGFAACTATCTHLGCTVQWSPGDRRFYCPCHGSIYDASGKVLAGPAPRPLDWFEVRLSKDGQIVVNKRKTVPPEQRLWTPL